MCGQAALPRSVVQRKLWQLGLLIKKLRCNSLSAGTDAKGNRSVGVWLRRVIRMRFGQGQRET